jgi:adenylosuccinate synthase
VGEGPFVAEYGGEEEELATVIRDRGNEYGTTTGRPRRCGWLDLLPVRYAAMVNRLGALALTKLDILSTVDPLRVCVAYRVDGKTIEDYPANSEMLERCEAVYQELPGWQDDISSIRKFSDLPQEARQYVQFVEEGAGVPVKYVGVGKEREELIQIP